MNITIVLVPSAQLRYEVISRETGRTIQNLISDTAEQAALSYFRHRKDDPARKPE